MQIPTEFEIDMAIDMASEEGPTPELLTVIDSSEGIRDLLAAFPGKPEIAARSAFATGLDLGIRIGGLRAAVESNGRQGR